jgi:hypothetical protein
MPVALWPVKRSTGSMPAWASAARPPPEHATFLEHRQRQRRWWALAALAGEPDQGLLAQHPFALAGRRLRRPGAHPLDDGQVQLAGLQGLAQAHREIAAQAQRDARTGLGKGLQHGREGVFHQLLGQAHPQLAGHAGGGEQAAGLVVQAQQAAGVVQQRAAFLGRPVEPALGPVQQGLAHLFFQALDLQADGRLAAAQALGGGREAAAVGNGHQGAQQVQVQVSRVHHSNHQ